MSTRNWLIALPIWGEQYRARFRDVCWPSWQAALAPIADRVRFMLHTDAPDFAALFAPYPVEILPRPDNNRRNYHAAFSAAHRHALDTAAPGEAVALQNADHILSRESFIAADRRFDEGFKAVLCAGTRTVGPLFGNPPPQDIAAADLLAWANLHMHPIVQQSVHPHGKTAIPSMLYYRDGTNTICRCFHLHPFAVIKDRELPFSNTVDGDLCENYARSEIHIVTDKDELAMAEVSPMSKRLPLREDGMSPDYIAWWAGVSARGHHRWYFEKRIVIEGTADTDCDAHADAILQLLEA